MSTGLDMSLDEIISKKKPLSRGGGRSGGLNRGGGGGGATRRSGGPIRNSRTQTRHRPYSSSAATSNINSITEGKILVSNLAFKVTEADLWELFTTMIGPVQQVNLNFDQDGRSKGTASVVFQKRTDAVKSVEKLRNVTLDGRVIKIEIVVAPNTNSGPINKRIGGVNENRAPTPKRGGAGNVRGGLRGKGRGGGRRTDNKPKKTQEELDAEMSEYMQIE